MSIFNPKEGTIKQDKEKIEEIISKLPDLSSLSLSHKEKSAIGSMLGMAIGDAMGHRFEFEDVKYNTIILTDMGEGPGGWFQLLPGQWTDDTSMGLCLADSLLINKEFDPHDLMLRFISWWYYGYNNAFRKNEPPRGSCGLGGIFPMHSIDI